MCVCVCVCVCKCVCLRESPLVSSFFCVFDCVCRVFVYVRV